jgi:hypothetical protein
MPDLADIPGIRQLWQRTTGDPAVRVALIDGPADLSHPCFAGADITMVEPDWLPELRDADRFLAPDQYANRLEHGTYVASMLFGQHGSPVTGLAPQCSGIIVAALWGALTDADPVNLARAIEAAVNEGAHVIVVEVCVGTCRGEVDGLLTRAVSEADRAGVLVVAGSGNDEGRCVCFPAVAPEVLAVGAYNDDGVTYKFSNWDPAYEGHGLVAPGGDIQAAARDGGLVTHKGTSCSGPVAAGVAALLLSLQVQRGLRPDPAAVREAMLHTAVPCTAEETHGEPDRCMAGKLDIARATRHILAQATPEPDHVASTPGHVPGVVVSEVSGGGGRLVYALGTLGYDFGTEARRDSFKQLMAPVAVEGPVVPANPYDGRQMAAHLAANAAEARALIWTLNLELTPVYAVEPVGAFAVSVYELLASLLGGETAAEDDEGFIERVSLPGQLCGRTVRLFSGQVVPVVEVEQVRGLYGWQVNTLLAAAAEAVEAAVEGGEGVEGDQADRVRGSLREFLTRVYYDLRNLGVTSRDRALNFAVTNAFQAARTFAAAVAAGMALDTIGVEKSPFCRMDSDCWDVKLRFFDPENSRRARRVFRFTIDVSDLMPVTLGEVRTWTEAG